MQARFIHALPNDIQRSICTLALQQLHFEKHQENFQPIHKELKKDEFGDIIHLRLGEVPLDVVKYIVFPELGDDVKDWIYLNKHMKHYNNTSTMVYKNNKCYNLIGNYNEPVHCVKCNMAGDALVNHRKRILECKKCKLNEKR